MDCLIDYIGVRYTQTGTLPAPTAPESGLYINDLPGITVAQLSDINNSDQATFLDTGQVISSDLSAAEKPGLE